jgi:hypothetical protein
MPTVNSCLPMLPVHRESQVHSKFVGTCSLSVVAPMSAGCCSCVNVNSIWKCSHRANLWEGPHSKSFKHPSCLFHSSRNQYGRADRGKLRILTLRSVLFMHCPSILKNIFSLMELIVYYLRSIYCTYYGWDGVHPFTALDWYVLDLEKRKHLTQCVEYVAATSQRKSW